MIFFFFTFHFSLFTFLFLQVSTDSASGTEDVVEKLDGDTICKNLMSSTNTTYISRSEDSSDDSAVDTVWTDIDTSVDLDSPTANFKNKSNHTSPEATSTKQIHIPHSKSRSQGIHESGFTVTSATAPEGSCKVEDINTRSVQGKTVANAGDLRFLPPALRVNAAVKSDILATKSGQDTQNKSEMILPTCGSSRASPCTSTSSSPFRLLKKSCDGNSVSNVNTKNNDMNSSKQSNSPPTSRMYVHSSVRGVNDHLSSQTRSKSDISTPPSSIRLSPSNRKTPPKNRSNSHSPPRSRIDSSQMPRPRPTKSSMLNPYVYHTKLFKSPETPSENTNYSAHYLYHDSSLPTSSSPRRPDENLRKCPPMSTAE